jgi:voltage-gated potassium channel
MSEEMRTQNTRQVQGVAHLHGTSYELFILVLTIFSLLVIALIFIWPGGRAEKAVLVRVDSFICLIFLADFLLNLWRAPSKAGYFFKAGGWLDLLGSIPVVPELPWTALLRIARLNRLIRIVNRLQGQDRGEVVKDARKSRAQSALLATIFVAIVLITVASVFILRVESLSPRANITTAADALWWAFVTITTVGYGDHVPVTLSGRILAMVLMTFGIGIFAVLAGFVATGLVEMQDQDDEEDVAVVVRKENAIIRAELAEIKELLILQGLMVDDENIDRQLVRKEAQSK